MKPRVLLWKYDEESQKDNAIIRGICFFSYVGAIASKYSKEDAEDISQYYHTAVYFPDVDESYENVANVDLSDFPNVTFKYAGARKFDKKMVATEEYEFYRDLTEEEQRKMMLYFRRSIVQKMKYHFVQFFVLMIVYPTRPVWDWLWKTFGILPPFTRSKNRERCNSYVENGFKAAGIDLLEGPEESKMVGELPRSKKLKRVK